MPTVPQMLNSLKSLIGVRRKSEIRHVCDAVSVDEFVGLALIFKDRLASASSFNEIREMWMSTSIAYRYESQDPFSPDYRAEVLRLYERLTREVYRSENELTSNKQSAETFEVGFPWISNNFEVIAQELAKTSQAMRAFYSRGMSNRRFIEFGAGWGNLAIPLARAQQDVAVVDIDKGFLERIESIARREKIEITRYHGDFVEVAKSITETYDAVIFQSSFHHCLEFECLLEALRAHVLNETGSIFFFSEPIYREYTFPWGLRYDGESLWAITNNNWLELGFDQEFFFHLLLRKGFFLSKIDAIPSFVGEGWVADRGESGINFDNWWLPDIYDATFVPRAATTGFGRFCLGNSALPGLLDGDKMYYLLEFENYCSRGMNVRIVAAEPIVEFILAGSTSCTVIINAACDKVLIQSETYVPNEESHNGDTRRVGVALKRVTLADGVDSSLKTGLISNNR